jgi:hypothetical protein
MKRIFGLFFAMSLAMGLCGCKNLEGPNWLHPGSAEEQQKRAIRYDPYPQTEIGPATTNVRPKSYDKTIAEPSQARWYLNGW